MKKRKIIVLSLGLLLLSSSVFAVSLVESFQKQKNIDTSLIKVPTVVEIPFNNDLVETNLFAVYNETTSLFEPYYFRKNVLNDLIPVVVGFDSGYDAEANLMVDNDFSTYKEFTVSGDKQQMKTIILSSDKPITSSSLTLMLDQNVALPNSIGIMTTLLGEQKVVLATQKLNSYNINFPKTTADHWMITFTYSQPLRITELILHQDSKKINNQGLRFLAQPNNNYTVYFNPDRFVKIPLSESANLSSNEGVVYLKESISQNNPSYILADNDLDGVPNIRDNCIEVKNQDQVDINGNGRGDTCDDFDKDGIINSIDNCPNNPNQNQLDSDYDKIGDVCDSAESRLTEKYKFIPWLGVAFAIITIVMLFVVTFKKKDN